MKKLLLLALLFYSTYCYSSVNNHLDIAIEGISPYKIDALYELYEESPDYIFTDQVLKNRVYYQQMMRSYVNKLDKEIEDIDIILATKGGKAVGILATSVALFSTGRWMFALSQKEIAPHEPNVPKALKYFFTSVTAFALSLPAAVQGVISTKHTVTYKNWLIERQKKGYKILMLLQD